MLGLRALLPCLLLSTCVGKALNIRFQRPAPKNSAAERQAAFRNQPGCSNGFNFRVQAYTPSKFESEWHQAVSRGDEDACQFMLANRARTKIWLETLQEIDSMEYNIHSRFTAHAPNRVDLPSSAMSADIFSKYTLVNVCPGEFLGAEKELMVEPLVGHLRHPYAVPACQPEGIVIEDPDIIGNLAYLRLNPWHAADHRLMYTGKKYLFDLGSTTFDTSLNYLTTRYRQAGIEFDAIWAWEVKNQDHEKYWSQVPEVYMPRLHFYNIPVTDNFTAPVHPLNIIRSQYQPGDFVVLKLDIDKSDLESAIMKEIESDPALKEMIAEISYEQHYDHPDINPWFGGTGGETTLKDVVRNFRDYRNSGMLVHYWP